MQRALTLKPSFSGTPSFRERVICKIRIRDNENKNRATMNGMNPGPGDRNVPKSNWIDVIPKKMLKESHMNPSKYRSLIMT